MNLSTSLNSSARPGGLDYHDLPIVKTDDWADGTVRQFIKCPFPPLGIRVELATGREIPLAVETEVALAGLFGTESLITLSGLDKDRDDSWGLPLVVHSNGVDYIQDGHHRLAKAFFDGEITEPVRYLDLDQLRNGTAVGLRRMATNIQEDHEPGEE